MGSARCNRASPLGINFKTAGGISFVGKIDIFGPERVGDCLIKSVRIDKAAVHHGLRDGFSIQGRFVQNIVRLRRLQDVLLDEDFSDLFVVHGRELLESVATALWAVCTGHRPVATTRSVNKSLTNIAKRG